MTVRTSTELKDDYEEISRLCHSCSEPVIITKNGKGDLAVMSVEAYEGLNARMELYDLLKDGIRDVREGEARPFDEAIADIRNRRKR